MSGGSGDDINGDLPTKVTALIDPDTARVEPI